MTVIGLALFGYRSGIRMDRRKRLAIVWRGLLIPMLKKSYSLNDYHRGVLKKEIPILEEEDEVDLSEISSEELEEMAEFIVYLEGDHKAEPVAIYSSENEKSLETAKEKDKHDKNEKQE